MVEHMGKKRRKEVQLACAARRELRTQLAATLVLLALICTCVVAVGILAVRELVPLGTVAIQVVFFAAIVLAVLCLVMRLLSWSRLREEYRQHCARLNITTEEMDALRAEQVQEREQRV